MVETERATIADLEIYGLSVRSINTLEKLFGFIYVDDLDNVTDSQLRTKKIGKLAFGDRSIPQLRTALRNFRAGMPVKTPEDCVVFDGLKPRLKKKPGS